MHVQWGLSVHEAPSDPGAAISSAQTAPRRRSGRWRGLSETTLSQIWHMPVKTCRLVETRRTILRFVETRRHILGQARITTKNPGADYVGSIFDQKSSKLGQLLSNWHAIFSGCVFFPEKNRKWHVSEAHGLYLPMFFCQSKILGGVFKYGLPDGLPEMAFQT